jgi:2-oxoisovalerate dehydrogenase E1 component
MSIHKLEESILQEALKIRRAEELLLEAFRNGLIKGTIHSCIGQEIIPVLVNKHFSDAFWFSNHRGHGHYLAKTKDFAGLFAEILGREGAVNCGIGGSQHINSERFMSNGIQGGQAGIAAGISSGRLSSNHKAVFFLGDGTLGAGHIYEAWNIAVLEQSRVLYVLEDNEISQSTPSKNNFRGNVKSRAQGFGLKYLEASSSDISGLQAQIKSAHINVEKGMPTLLHIHTQRLGPHSKGDDNRSEEDIKLIWENDLLNKQIKIQPEIKLYVKEIDQIFKDVQNRSISQEVQKSNFHELSVPMIKNHQKINLKELINKSLTELLLENQNLYMLGEDISDDQFDNGIIYGGAFKITSGLSSLAKNRVISTPISESGFTGYGIGLALAGNPVIVEIMFGDFITQNFDQIVHQLSKIPSMYGMQIKLPFILRAAVGSGNGYGPTHSSYLDACLLGLPNIDLVSVNPFTNYLDYLKNSIASGRPMIIFEPKRMYQTQATPQLYSEYYLGSGSNSNFQIIKPKNKIPFATIFTHGAPLLDVLNLLEKFAVEDELFFEIYIPEQLNSQKAPALTESLGRTNGNLIAIEESVGNFGTTAWFLQILSTSKVLKNFVAFGKNGWVPSGNLEANYIESTETILFQIRDWILNDKNN